MNLREVRQVKGARKETAGQTTGNPRVEAEDQGEKVDGKTQNTLGQAEKVFEE
jgi:uncharacterized protein YjbJ (UPF0337 family)